MPSIKDLEKKIKTDEAFKSKFVNVKDMEEAVNIANELGFDITTEDIESSDELSEDLLDAVAGGGVKTVDMDKIDNRTVVLGPNNTVHYE